MKLCRCRVEPVICFLDELVHWAGARRWAVGRWICDRHESNITARDHGQPQS